MNIFGILFILAANISAYYLIFRSMGKQMESSKKTRITLIIIGATYIITQSIYYLSGLGVAKVKNSQVLQNSIMMIFVPINLLIIVPYSINAIVKTKKGKQNKKILNKKLIIVELLAVIILVFEFFYFRYYQKNVKKSYDEANKIVNNEVIENLDNENSIDNDITNSTEQTNTEEDTTNDIIENVENTIVNSAIDN